MSTPAERTDEMNKSAPALTDRQAVPAQTIIVPLATYTAALQSSYSVAAERGLDLLSNMAALSENRSTHEETIRSVSPALHPPRPATALRGAPVPIWGSVLVGRPVARDSGVVVHEAAARGGGIHARGRGAAPQRGVSRANTPARNIEQGDAPQPLMRPTNRDASDKRAASESFPHASEEGARESSVGVMYTRPPSAAG